MKLKRKYIDAGLITCGVIFVAFTIACPPTPVDCVPTGGSGCVVDMDCCEYPDAYCADEVCMAMEAPECVPTGGSGCVWDEDCCDYPDAYCVDGVCMLEG